MDIVHDYVKKFSGMMLDIKYMFEEDKFFYFLEELKPWARMNCKGSMSKILPPPK